MIEEGDQKGLGFPQIERENTSEDPRVYIDITNFQRRIEKLQPKLHVQVENISSKVVDYSDDQRVIMAGETYTPEEDHPFGLVVVTKDEQGSLVAHKWEGVPQRHLGIIEEAVTAVGRHIPQGEKIPLINQILEESKSLHAKDFNEFYKEIYELIISSVPDLESLPSVEGKTRFLEISPKVKAKTTEQLNSLLHLISPKLPASQMDTLVKKIDDLVYFSPEVTNNDLVYIYSLCLNTILDNNPATVPNYENLSGNSELKVFKPKVYAVRFPETVEEMEAVFENLPTPKPEPIQFTRAKTHRPRAEMVRISDVVGGRYERSFLIEDVPKSRGVDRIIELIKGYKEGQGLNPKEPIHVYKYRGEYWVGNDGNHRVSAFKAMGLDSAPMLVQEVIK